MTKDAKWVIMAVAASTTIIVAAAFCATERVVVADKEPARATQVDSLISILLADTVRSTLTLPDSISPAVLAIVAALHEDHLRISSAIVASRVQRNSMHETILQRTSLAACYAANHRFGFCRDLTAVNPNEGSAR